MKTVAAIATAGGKGAIGIVRITGNKSLKILQQVFVSKTEVKPNLVRYGELVDPCDKSLVDICMTVFYKAPHSYSGEDSAEIFCHGGIAVLSRALNAVIRAGADYAGPGDFTKRAFLNGKLDLYDAEAVVDLIDADSEAAASNAVNQLSGLGKNNIVDVRQLIIHTMSSLYAEIDFPDEGVPTVTNEEIVEALESAECKISTLLSSYKRGRLLKDGIPIALIGRPNVGKSSLLNRLCGSERAIVTEIAGTTRDIIDEKFTYKNTVFRAFDTAGIRETDDTVEKIGVSRAVKAAENASAVLVIVDGSAPLTEEDTKLLADFSSQNLLVVSNKADISDAYAPAEAVKISAKTGLGIDTLCEKIYDITSQTDENSKKFDVLITNERQAAALSSALDSIKKAIDAINRGLTADVILSVLESAANSLGEITGQTASEDIISDIFSRFCVGK